GGAVTLSRSTSLFRQCAFTDNQANGVSGGGAVEAIDGAQATFVDCSFERDSARQRGGALDIHGATVSLRGGDLVDDHTDGAGSDPNSFGGAIAVIDGTLRVFGTRFERDRAAWVGGAIYAIGAW